MSDSIIWVRTCKACSHDNQENAGRCNGCGQKLEGAFSKHFLKRWACPKCNTLNMEENNKCLCGHSKGLSGGMWAVIIIGGFILLKIFLK